MFKNGGIEEHKEIYRKHSANIHNYVYIYTCFKNKMLLNIGDPHDLTNVRWKRQNHRHNFRRQRNGEKQMDRSSFIWYLITTMENGP